MKILLQTEENYYNSKRANNQSYQTFFRILIVVFLGAFVANTSWNSLHVPFLAYAAALSLLFSILQNLYMFSKVQNSLDQVRTLTHRMYDENDITYIDEIQHIRKKANRRSELLLICFIISIIICTTSYIVEKTLEPKEVTQMAKQQQSTQQPSKEVVMQKEKRTWDTPSLPITPTDMPAKPVGTPAEPTTPVQPTDTPSQPAPKPADKPTQPSNKK